MGFNNGLERRKFEAQWSRLRVEYAASGMDESAILAMYEFDRQTYNSDRRYAEHTQAISQKSFSDDGDEAGEDKAALLMKFSDSLTTKESDMFQPDRTSWVDEIESKKLRKGIAKLSVKDREVLALYVFFGYTMDEIAEKQGVSQPAISKKLARIKKILRKYR